MNQVHATSPRGSTLNNKIRDTTERQRIVAEHEIEDERLMSINDSEKRTKTFENIVSNVNIESKSFFKHFASGLGGVIAAGALISVYTVLPVHDVISDSCYWYEFPLQTLFTFIPIASAKVCWRCSYYINIKRIKSRRDIMIVSLISWLMVALYFPTGYLIWTYMFNYQYPIPWNGFLVSFVFFPTLLISIWFRFPKSWRKEETFRRRLKWMILSMIFNQALTLEYQMLTNLLKGVPSDYQWIVALFLPIIREFNGYVLLKMTLKSASGDTDSVEIVVNHVIATSHALFVTYTAGSYATMATTAVMIGTDFLINIYTAIKIAYIQRKSTDRKEEQSKLLQELVINEMVEVLVPLAYMLCFTLAYFGPNAELIGGVRSSYFDHSPVEFGSTMSIVSAFFCIDLLSLVISGIFLKIVCNISVAQAFITLQKEFGIQFGFVLAGILTAVNFDILTKNIG